MAKEPCPMVSVIIPTYNRAHVLGRAIKSVIDQTFTDFELIVVDDGSTDNTEELVTSFDDSRIRFLRHGQNRGVSAARNTGIRWARGQYIAFQDSDDEWLPQKLERQIEVFRQDKTGKLGLVNCGASLNVNLSEQIFIPDPHLLNFDELLHRRNRCGTGTILLMIRKELAGGELYFDESLPASEDWDLMVRLSRLVDIDTVSEPLVRINRVDGEHVSSEKRTIHAEVLILQKYYEELRARPEVLSYHHEKLAWKYYHLGDMRHARAHFGASIAVCPTKPASYMFFIASLFGVLGFRSLLRARCIFQYLINGMRSLLSRDRK